MRKLALRRPSPALVVACIALLIALGGTSIAAVTQVAKNSVGANQLKNNAVTNPKMANNAVKAPELASNAVVAAKIASNAVTGAKIAANAVTGAKIADGSVAAADLASGVLPAPSAAFARFVNGPGARAGRGLRDRQSQHSGGRGLRHLVEGRPRVERDRRHRDVPPGGGDGRGREPDDPG